MTNLSPHVLASKWSHQNCCSRCSPAHVEREQLSSASEPPGVNATISSQTTYRSQRAPKSPKLLQVRGQIEAPTPIFYSNFVSVTTISLKAALRQSCRSVSITTFPVAICVTLSLARLADNDPMQFCNSAPSPLRRSGATGRGQLLFTTILSKTTFRSQRPPRRHDDDLVPASSPSTHPVERCCAACCDSAAFGPLELTSGLTMA